MDRRGSTPARPRSLRLDSEVDPVSKSASPSPASEVENKRLLDETEKFDEISEYIKEVDEVLNFIQPFPRKRESTERAEPKLNHLENLIKLVEQLKELKEKNSESQQRSHLLKQLKSRRLTKFVGEDCLDLPPPPPDPPKKHRPSLPFRKSFRSKSLSAHEYFTPDRLISGRKSVSQGKSKVSKWTKVKEAFRWEKASQVETRWKHKKEPSISDDVKATVTDDVQSQCFLQVPDRPGDTPSPADSVLSGQISTCSSLGAASSSCLLVSSGYSGEHSSAAQSSCSVHMLGLPTSPLSHNDFLCQSLQELSSSSDEEKHSFVQKEIDDCETPKSPLPEDVESRRSKSLDGASVLGPNLHLIHLSKESLHEEGKAPKQHKTPWGKVIDIIQTRKDSLKKRPKKRDEFKADAEAFSANLPPSWIAEEHASDDVSSPEDVSSDIRPKIEVTFEKTPQNVSLMTRRSEGFHIRPLTPMLMLTRPSTEELQKLPSSETELKENMPVLVSPISNSDEDGKVDHQLAEVKVKNATLPQQGRSSRWGRVKKAFLTSSSQEFLPPGPTSVPSSPVFLGSFFSDNDSDDLSSGEWMDEKQDKLYEPSNSPGLDSTFLQAEMQRTFSESMNKNSLETEAEKRDCETVSCNPYEKNEGVDSIPRKPRESLSIPLPTLDDLSPEFKKKLDEWKKIKKTPQTPTSAKDEPGHFISKFGEKWGPGSSHKTDSHQYKQEHHLREEFYKKLEEWQMLKGGKRSKSHSDRGKDDRQTPSPGLSRKNSKRLKKQATSGKSSGAESLSGSIKEKEGRSGRKTQKEKDLHWLEKELQKIEREKLRLEREREKYLEREARLEQMKRTMGTTIPSQEVLIRTATGFFRFEGISQKFTKKLYEWEKARGIAPEASTFALLESARVPCRNREDRSPLQRSKSVGSVIDTSSAAALSLAHHPSSLSLNDKDDLEQANLLADAVRMASEVDLDCVVKDDDEPEALIVDVEDVVVETAAMMQIEPQFEGQVPVYSYAPAEVTQLIDSNDSDAELDVQIMQADSRKISDTNATLIDQNIDLLEKLEKKEAICREIENDLENIEEKIGNQETQDSPPKENLLLQGENLKHSFLQHSEQQQEIVHDLVDNLRLLHAANSTENPDMKTDVNQVIDLSSQLLYLAQKLEQTLTERNADHSYLRRRDRARVNRIGAVKVWYSTDEEASAHFERPVMEGDRSLAEISDLPSMITKKVLELKNGLSKLKESANPAEGTAVKEEATASFTLQMPRRSSASSLDSEEMESRKKTYTKRPSLVIVPETEPLAQEDLSPVSVTLCAPSLDLKQSRDSPEKRIEKSKTQAMFSQGAEEVFEKHLKVVAQRQEQKSPEVLKKKIKEKIVELQRMTTEARPRKLTRSSAVRVDEVFKSDDDDDHYHGDDKVIVVKKNVPKKGLKTRRITDTTIAYQACASDTDSIKGSEGKDGDPHEGSPLTGTTPDFVFVPTTRKIISPVELDTSSSVLSYVIDDIEPKPEEKQNKHEDSDKDKNIEVDPRADIGIPPIPNSPSLARRLLQKDAAPSIRMMIAKFNQKITESQLENEEHAKGTSSPVGWKSPILERRLKAQIGRFENDGEDALKHGGKFRRDEVQKSASAGFIKAPQPSNFAKDEVKKEECLKGILKSSSAGAVGASASNHGSSQDLTISRTLPKEYGDDSTPLQPLAVRALMIRQAKAEFFSRGPGGQSWTSDVSQTPTSISSTFSWHATCEKQDSASEEMRLRNRLSHASVGSESSFDEGSVNDDYPNLIKSASAGMINLERGIYSRSSEGNVEQPCVQKTIGLKDSSSSTDVTSKKSSRFGISNIKSKFRKVKMRKTKEKETPGAVSVLCRQSLLLDVSRPVNVRTNPQPSCSKSCPSSPILDRSRAEESKKWVPLQNRLFKSKESKRLSSDFSGEKG